MDARLGLPLVGLRVAIGLTALLAGADKFFDLLADWSMYVSPWVASLLPVSTATLMQIVGVVEMAVGATILAGWTRLGGYTAGAWLVLVASNLALAGFYDVAVRDVVMSIAAFTLARLAEVESESAGSRAPAPARRPLTA
jgi:hypothetical protein